MTKRYIILSVLFILNVFIISAQADTTFKLVRVLHGDIVDFTIDDLDNIYILNSRNQVKKNK